MPSITPKEYQKKAFRDLETFCKLLKENPKRPQNAWEDFWEAKRLTPSSQSFPYAYQARRTTEEPGLHIPHTCFNVPTGGGKTIMACEALRIIQHAYLNRSTGLVLWLVPNDSIYKQTVKAFRDLESPERNLLKTAGLNRVKVVEFRQNKRESFSVHDVENSLVVMPLTIQSFNAKNERKIRKETGQFLSFFPKDFDVKQHQALLDAANNLECYPFDELPTYSANNYHFVRSTLENVFRICRPVIVVDEAHNVSISENKVLKAMDYIRSYNPSYIMEISATPKPQSNILVKASGLDLLNEQMIKLPVNLLDVHSDTWQQCVDQTIQKQQELERLAKEQEGETGIYLRPIVLITAERTGKDQQGDASSLHIEDVKHYLLSQGIPEGHIKKQTAEEKELDGVDLMARGDVRYILTKNAIAEGWNCPFAYILCSVDRVTTAGTRLTQLVGRILRQPYVKQFKLQALNECYVFALNNEVKQTYEAIKKGLENEGYQSGALKVPPGYTLSENDEKKEIKKVTVKKREKFQREEVFLPQVTFQEDGKEPVLFSWEAHIFPFIDYSQVRLQPIADLNNKLSDTISSHLVNFNAKSELEHQMDNKQLGLSLGESSVLDPLYIYSRFQKIIPNAWQAHQTVAPVLRSIQDSKNPIKACDEYVKEAERQIYKQCEAIFRNHVASGRVKFSLTAQALKESIVWQPVTIEEAESTALHRENGTPLERNLFEPVWEEPFNNDEKTAALYLDTLEAVKWWYRIEERKRHSYRLKGWERRNIYPDFLIKREFNGQEATYFLYETKGDQLSGNEDTHYKASLLELLEKEYAVVGDVSFTSKHPERLNARMVMQGKFLTQCSQDFGTLNT